MTIPVLIVPTLLHYNLLQYMLNSIDYKINEIIIVDNGGKLENATCEFANKISIINMPRNLGVAASWNLGIKLTPHSERWLIASDDITFIPGALQRLDESKYNSIIFTKSNNRYFSAFGIHESLIEKIGLFNEYFYPGIGEEVDYIEKLYKNNVQIYDIKNFYLHHNNGGNTLNYFGLNRNATGEKAKLIAKSLSYDNKEKLDRWDLKHRRYIETILND